MKKRSILYLLPFLLLMLYADVLHAQKCRYDMDLTHPGTQVRTRRVHVDLDKRWAILFQQEDTVYSVCLLLDIAADSSVKIQKGNMWHIGLDNGKIFDLFVSEDVKTTIKENPQGSIMVYQAKCIIDKHTLALFAADGLAGMKLHMGAKEQAFEMPDDHTKKLVMKAASCMMKE